MSQASTERLRDYLAQLPPQSLALLMREFERAVEKGEDTKVANLVLEQLRKILRQAEEDDDARPRTDDPARLLFRPLEPFLAESNFPVRPGLSAAPRCCRCGNGSAATACPCRHVSSSKRWPGRMKGLRSRLQPASSSSPLRTRSVGSQRLRRPRTDSER